MVKLLKDIGVACSFYQNEVMRTLLCKHIECDEIWTFCDNKEKNVAPEHCGILAYGDVYIWTALDVDTRLVPFLVAIFSNLIP